MYNYYDIVNMFAINIEIIIKKNCCTHKLKKKTGVIGHCFV